MQPPVPCPHKEAREQATRLLKRDPVQSLEIVKSVLKLPACTDSECSIDLYLLAAEAAFRSGARDESIQYLLNVLPTSAPHRVRALLLRAQLAHSNGETSQAGVLFRQAAQTARDSQLNSEEGDVLSLLAQMEHSAGKSQEALVLLNRVVTLREAAGDVDGLIRALCNKTVVLNTQGNLREALEVLQEAQRQLPNCQSPLQSALQVYFNLGRLHEQTQQYADAYHQFKLALDVARRAEDQPAQVIMALNAGGMATKIGQREEAFALLEQGLEDARRLGHMEAQAAALHSLALLHSEIGNHAKATEAFNQAEVLAQNSGDVDRQLDVLLGHAVQYLDHGMVEEAQAPLERALVLAEKAERSQELLQAHEMLARLYEESAPKTAIQHLKSAARIAAQLRDTVLTQQAQDLALQAELQTMRREVVHERQLRVASEQARAEALAALDRGRFYDDLTQLPNRVMMHVLLAQAVEQAERDGQGVSIGILDINRFKQVNDALGPAGGDELLRAVAERLKKTLQSREVLSRSGNNEFVVLLLGQTPDHRTTQAERLLDTLRENFRVQGLPVSVQASMGLAHHPEDGTTPDDLHRAAHIALNDAREHSQTLSRYQGGGQERQASLHFEALLAGALNQGEFEIHYQPIVNAATGEVHSAEALLRWNSAELGRRSPMEFIPVLERNGLIIPVGSWVLHEACRAAATWKGVRVAVNLSARQFQQGDLLGTVRSALQQSGLKPELLEIEITESLMIQSPQRVQELLTGLKRMGVRVMLDDFGTGYSNLSILRTLAVTGLKIDRSFISALERGENSSAQAMIIAVVQLSQALGLETVAEGVEYQEEHHLLRELGVHYLQGYLFARPAPGWKPHTSI